MSCIAGLFHRGGAPVDSRVLADMLARMRPRAPHGDLIRCEGPIGLAHAFLRTGRAPTEAPAPMVCADGLWVCADARIDGRSYLLAQLRSAGREVDADATPGELIGHAYRAFGAAFLDKLIGDFAFALWDPACRILLAARDHFGVRPFHYAEVGELFAFASDADALLAVPGVSRELDEFSVADFLIFTSPQEPQRSMYRDIRCLPPATRLSVTFANIEQRRFWELPEDADIPLRSPSEYVEGFVEVFEQAVTDRLPAGPVALQLSGGLDSSSIAAVAAARAQHPVTAYNVSTRRLVPEDDEEHYAQLIASQLGIPLVCQDLCGYRPYERIDEPRLRTASPQIYAFLSAHDDLLRQMSASGAAVLLSGHGGDSAMSPSVSHYARLLRGGRVARLAAEALHHARHSGSFRGMGLRSALLPRDNNAPWTPPFPEWIDADFAKRVDLAGRWSRVWTLYEQGVDNHRLLTQPWLSRNFETLEALKLPVIVRYPFHDIRVVEYLHATPNFMRTRKRILREAMHGRLPPPVLSRGKTSAPGDFVHRLVTNGSMPVQVPRNPQSYPAPINGATHLRALNGYAVGSCPDSTWNTLLMFAPVVLANWMSHSREGTLE